jgi:hypothetical protein
MQRKLFWIMDVDLIHSHLKSAESYAKKRQGFPEKKKFCLQAVASTLASI